MAKNIAWSKLTNSVIVIPFFKIMAGCKKKSLSAALPRAYLNFPSMQGRDVLRHQYFLLKCVYRVCLKNSGQLSDWRYGVYSAGSCSWNGPTLHHHHPRRTYYQIIIFKHSVRPFMPFYILGCRCARKKLKTMWYYYYHH